MRALSRRSMMADNPIEEEGDLAEQLARSGHKVLSLNRGDPTAYFPTPSYLLREFVSAIKKGYTGYSYPTGIIELREAISARYKRAYKADVTPDKITVTQGVSEAITFLNSIFINHGDRAVIARPYYPLYVPALRVSGGSPIFADSDWGNGAGIDMDSLRRKLNSSRARGAKYMLFSNPSNPTGTVMGRKVLEELASLCNDNDIFLISDEIYDEIVYRGVKFTSVCEVARGIPHAILAGASKSFDATGFRIGYAALPEDDAWSEAVRDRLEAFARMRLSSSTPAQYAFAKAISNVAEHKKSLSRMVAQMEDRARFAHGLVNKSRYMHASMPKGAFYILAKIFMEKLDFRDDKDIEKGLLLEEGIQVARGSGFGAPGSMRIVALAPKDILGLAIRKIDKFFEKHSK